jgi:hypothetical protein
MNEKEMIDKKDNWAVSGELTIDNALKETLNKWNDIYNDMYSIIETTKIVCGMCQYANCGECDICVLSKQFICNSDNGIETLYSETINCGTRFIDKISELIHALENVSYTDAYKDELRYKQIQNGEV